MAISAAPAPASIIRFIPTPSLRGLAADRYHDEIAQSINRCGLVTIAAACCSNATALLRMNWPRYSLNCPAAALPSGVAGNKASAKPYPLHERQRGSTKPSVCGAVAPLPHAAGSTALIRVRDHEARLVSSCRRRLLAAGVIADIRHICTGGIMSTRPS